MLIITALLLSLFTVSPLDTQARPTEYYYNTLTRGIFKICTHAGVFSSCFSTHSELDWNFELWSTFNINARKRFLSHSLSLKNTESTWQMPAFHGYSVAYVDADTGRRFWQHEKTGETTWY